MNDRPARFKDENFRTQVLKDFAWMQFDTDEAFNEYLTEKETAISTANQNMVKDWADRRSRYSPQRMNRVFQKALPNM